MTTQDQNQKAWKAVTAAEQSMKGMEDGGTAELQLQYAQTLAALLTASYLEQLLSHMRTSR